MLGILYLPVLENKNVQFRKMGEEEEDKANKWQGTLSRVQEKGQLQSCSHPLGGL